MHPAITRENTRLGIFAGIFAYFIWGLVPIFFKRIAEVPAGEIIAHRVVWAMVLMTMVIGFGRGFADGVDGAINVDGQCFAGELVDHVQHLEGAAIGGGVELEVHRPDDVRTDR